MREIYIVNATQVVTSQAHPEGLYSVLPNYPKTFDSNSYDVDTEKALRMAKSDYLSQESAFYASDNRAKWMVTLETSDGKQIMRESFGAFPDMTPIQPEPQTEPQPEEPEG